MATRQAPKVPTFTKSQVATAIAADDKKRRARASSKRAAKKATLAADHDDERARAAALEAKHAAEEAEREATNRANEEKAWTEDAIALGRDPAEYILEQRQVDPEGPKKRELTYFGPMLALRTAAKSYVKAENGILCNGDALAVVCGKHTRDQVVKALSVVMNVAYPGFGTPYAHLNPGQQSMNLRNKTRHALKSGLVTMALVIETLESRA